MKRAKSKTFEFLTLFVMTVGTVVGAGIYFKNKEILLQSQNPIIAILLWLIVGVVCVVAIAVFFEISSSTKNSGNGTLGNWLKLFVGRRVASFFSVLYVVMYVPAYNALFAGTFVFFFLQVIGVDLSWQVMLTIYLVLGIVLLFAFHILNALSFQTGKAIQLFGTFFKFIPLAIAFIAGFVLIGKQPDGAMFTQAVPGAKEGVIQWSTSNWNPLLFFRGFGGVLLAFDGFIYLANQQKNFRYKEVVPTGIFMGMLFAAIFYVLMAISLFLGSPDGSVVALIEKLLNVGDDNKISTLISNLLLMFICLLNINLFVMIGVRNIQSDLDAKLLYAGARAGKVSEFKSAIVQGIVSCLVYSIFILMGFFLSPNINDIKINSGHPTAYIDIMSSIAGIISFSLINLLIIFAMINRKTKKVKVEPIKYIFIIGPIAAIFISIFVIFGLYAFIDPKAGNYTEEPWIRSTGFYFLILFISLILVSVIGYLIQELLFKRHPFENGFDGYVEGTDPHPWTFRFNLKDNYFKHDNKVKYKKKEKVKKEA